MTSDLTAERRGASFESRSLTYLLDGGEARTLNREHLERIVEADPVFRNDDVHFLSRPDRYRRAMQKQRRLVELAKDLNLPPAEQGVLRQAVHDDLGTDLQHLMFIPNLMATFSDEQLSHWLPQALSWQVIGAYCQTELGRLSCATHCVNPLLSLGPQYAA